ncbi:MAG TPA: hypothetical protein DC054_01660 [Blastocatellia bacterium]|nr:hypothetical protein [Blastocatellia bacterium]
MPKLITDKDAVEQALKGLDLTAQLFDEQDGKLKHGTDLEVMVRGREREDGKKIGPYVRLLSYESGEEIVRQGEWGGNIFYISTFGSLDVYVRGPDNSQRKINQLPEGTCFGEMSVLAGVERNATVAVPSGGAATVLEVSRPALRLLQKLTKFGEVIDSTYRAHGKSRVIEDLISLIPTPVSPAVVDYLRRAAKFRIYGKYHVLCEEKTQVERIILIREGWVRRVRGIPFSAAEDGISLGLGESIGVDFLGAGNCLGLENVAREASWLYTASVMARTEVLEVPIEPLFSDPSLRDQLISIFSQFSSDDKLPPTIEDVPDPRILTTTEKEISTGIVDGVNLLVMDMDLCIRCGNCSLACHEVHGQSRLLRRGISITRPVSIGRKKTQHVLSPQVCMHCKDPECLTGCPTTAIFRDPNGDIDIDPTTCIGCFDCATQCPYDAISMVPRQPKAAARPNLWTRIKRILSLSSPQPPPSEEHSKDMVAIKCNLCENTSLNPPGATRKAYSCEENCPTGALVRVNPLEYFSETGQTLGVVLRDQTHAIGRNIHKSDPIAKQWHIAGSVVALVLTLAAIGGLTRYGFNKPLISTWLTMRWITGLVGTGSVAAVMTYPLRRQIYRRRAGALRYWLLAHVYLGTIAAILLFLHAGTHTGGLITTSLHLTFDLVIVSGLIGIACYLIVPRIMTKVEGEPLLLEDLILRRTELREALDKLVHESQGQLREEIVQRVCKKFLSTNFLFRQFAQPSDLKGLLAESRQFFRDRTMGRLTDAERALLLEAVETAVTIRRLDALVYLHKSLKFWIAPHVIASSLMLVFMIAHIVQVIFFAVR